MPKNKIGQITRAALFLAILITWQFSSRVFGNQYITGSGVNLILAVSVCLCGLVSGLAVALLSNPLAALIGVGPNFPPLIPFIMAGNVVYVITWHFLARLAFKKKFLAYIIAALAAAFVKFAVLYFGIVKFAAGFFPELPAAAVIMFSYPQLITALTGGVVACAVLPFLDGAGKIK